MFGGFGPAVNIMFVDPVIATTIVGSFRDCAGPTINLDRGSELNDVFVG